MIYTYEFVSGFSNPNAFIEVPILYKAANLLQNEVNTGNLMFQQNIYRGVVAEHLICRSNGFVQLPVTLFALYIRPSQCQYITAVGWFYFLSPFTTSFLAVCEGTYHIAEGRKVPKINKITRGSVIIIKSSENTPEGRAQTELVVFMRGAF